MRAAFVTLALALAASATSVIPPYNLVQLLQLVPDMSTLVTAVVAADLQGALSGKGPFTIMAPDNGAFEQLPPGVLPALLKNVTLLTEVLTYHVVAGNVSSGQLKNGEEVPTLNGKNITVDIYDNKGTTIIALDRYAVVLYANNYATNGVFHQIDRVLLPPRSQMSAGLQAVFAASARLTADKLAHLSVAYPNLNLVQRLQLVPELSTLVTAVVAADLVTTLSGPGPFTVFTPTNIAFDRVPNLPAILKNKTLLTEILTYHVVAGNVSSSQLTNDEEVPTVEGDKIKVNIFDKQGQTVVILNDKVRGLELDNYCNNGVFHIIDGVLVP